MPDSIEAIKELWNKAEQGDKEEYLFKALIVLQKDVMAGINEIKKTCECRENNCKANFITRKQANIVVMIGVALFIGLALGTGYITWHEAVKAAANLVP